MQPSYLHGKEEFFFLIQLVLFYNLSFTFKSVDIRFPIVWDFPDSSIKYSDMTEIKKISRKQFIVWGAGILSAFGLVKIAKPFIKKESANQKFLTEDGRLVEVDTKHVSASGNKIQHTELDNWIKS